MPKCGSTVIRKIPVPSPQEAIRRSSLLYVQLYQAKQTTCSELIYPFRKELAVFVYRYSVQRLFFLLFSVFAECKIPSSIPTNKNYCENTAFPNDSFSDATFKEANICNDWKDARIYADSFWVLSKRKCLPSPQICLCKQKQAERELGTCTYIIHVIRFQTWYKLLSDSKFISFRHIQAPRKLII
jgi:hypothetical protein